MASLAATRVLVTGGTSGLGRAMAEALVSAGARVALTSRELERAEAVAAELGAGGGHLVTISMNEQTMVRRGFVPYGPAGAAVDALAQVMAADLTDTPVTSNILLPGGATATGMVPDEMSDEARAGLLDPAIMGPPIVWLASAQAAGVRPALPARVQGGQLRGRRGGPDGGPRRADVRGA